MAEATSQAPFQGEVPTEGSSETAQALRLICPAGLRFCETNPFLDTFPKRPHQSLQRRRPRGARGTTPSASGGLEALELVQGFVEPPLYGHLVA